MNGAADVRVYDGRQMRNPEVPKCPRCDRPKSWHRGHICGVDCLCDEEYPR